MDLYEKVQNLAQADFRSNGFYLNAPYRVMDGGEVYVGRIRECNEKGCFKVVIERPAKVIGSVTV